MPVREHLNAALEPAEAAAFALAERKVMEGGGKALAEALPSLARKVGRRAIGEGRVVRPMAGGAAAVAGLDRWRACDAAGLLLVEASRAGDATLVEIWLHGDLEERAILLRALALLPVGEAAILLLDEVQRTNTQSHFEAAVCDSNLLVRAREHPAFDLERLNKLVLKAAFLGVDLERLFDVEAQANPELSRMLADLASEREAAGRATWPGTHVLLGHAPVKGSAARLLGGLEHGDDRQRAAAVRGLIALRRKDLHAFAHERLGREPRAEVRELLERLLD